MESSSREISSNSSRQFQILDDRKWATYLHDDSEEKPKTSIKTRMKVIENSEEKLRKEAYKRGITAWKTTKIPIVEGQIPAKSMLETDSEHEISMKKDAEARDCLDGVEEAVKNEKKSPESKKRKDGLEHEEDVKKWREHQPLQYFWKPDPLFYLHLTQLGYSRKAVEKALYYTDNKSVDLAEKYIQEHPDLTPLTKEEVLADAEAFLNEIRPQNLEDEDCGASTSFHGNEIKKDGICQRMELDTEARSFHASKMEHSKGGKGELSGHLKEKLKINKETETEEEKVELFCVINPDTALNVATLAMECSRATVKIMEELQNDKWKKLREDWTKYGKCVNAYQTDSSLHLHRLKEELLHDGHLSYLAEIQNPHSSDSPLPVVLCILTSTHYFRKIYPRLSKVN